MLDSIVPAARKAPQIRASVRVDVDIVPLTDVKMGGCRVGARRDAPLQPHFHRGGVRPAHERLLRHPHG